MPMNNRILRPLARPLLLDAVPGAAAAYSLRQLSNAYTGPVVTVRRSSDNAEEDFKASEIDDGTLTAFCGAGNGLVKTWHDQSGNGRDASQSTSSLQPRCVASGTLTVDSNTSLPALEFRPAAAVESSLDLSLIDNIQHIYALARNDNTVFVTITRNSSANDLRGFFIRLAPDKFNLQQIGSSPQTHPFLISTGETHLLYVSASGTESQYGMDGAVAAPEAETDFIQVSQIGKYHTSTFNLKGFLSELIMYQTPLSGTLQRRIEGDIAWYY